MRKLVLYLVAAGALSVIPTAAASPTIRLTIMHVLHGCHVWGTVDSRALGATRAVTLKHGGRIEIRVSCPMGFDVTQTAGPKLSSGLGRWATGTTHTLVFAKRGVYRFQAVNVESSADMNLQTLGSDNTPRLVVRVG